ncbi:MAG: DUF4398 domain-containing protein [Deltaproteobacteria bacterium]|nr:DUF4398 domain-containing protein [Deltaproteobacteria bacterium]
MRWPNWRPGELTSHRTRFSLSGEMTSTIHYLFVRRIPATIVLLIVAGMLATACASDRAIRDAEAALAMAREAHADYLAPGEFRSAENWLAEAHVRLRAADHDAAQSYAQFAEGQANAALFVAKRYGTDQPVGPPPPEPSSPRDDDVENRMEGDEP